MKFAVITGASRGLGMAMAAELLKSDWTVVGWDLKNESMLSHKNFHLKAVNVTDESSIRSAADEAIKQFGIPHALINNAGITKDILLHKMTSADFDATYKVNVVGTFLPTQILGSKMRDANSAEIKAGTKATYRRIVMLSSIAGVFGNVGQANYAASKAAVVGFMKSVAKEWGRYGISAIAVAPGLMKTEMTKTIPEEIMKSFLDRTPLQRMGTAEELASFIAYLCREESGFLHGEVIPFAGGLLL